MQTIDVARLLLGLAFLVSLISLYQTLSHVWDADYYFESLPDGPQHARFHFLREAMGDVGAIAIVAIILAQPAANRAPILWWILAVTVAKYSARSGSAIRSSVSAPRAGRRRSSTR